MDKTKLNDIINESSSYPNKDILEALYFLSDEHEKIKQELITKSHYLDDIEGYYDKLLEEYKNRTKK